MRKGLIWLDAIYRLGLLNVVSNAIYRIKLKCGYFESKTPIKKAIKGTLFPRPSKNVDVRRLHFEVSEKLYENAELLILGRYKLFYLDEYNAGSPPNWFYHKEDVFDGHWTKSPVNKFCSKDIKLTWDISRFHWIQQLSCAYSASGDTRFFNLINSWFQDWNEHNPVNSGVNWACGQECSIRVIHVLNATEIIKPVLPNMPTLIDFVIEHARRIEPSISYAISQDNNHGTSEAAALFICGAWLSQQTDTNSEIKTLAKKWTDKGRSILENRVNKLVFDDGGFSMYSTNYHRVFLNTISIVEFWRVRLEQNVFSANYVKKCRAATEWLYKLVDPRTGDTLNLGANDGSNPFIVQSADYRDFRPSIQIASVLFFNEKFYKSDETINEPLNWLGIEHLSLRYRCDEEESLLLPDSGIVILRSGQVSNLTSVGFVKYPNYRFRPNQADLLHFDLWHQGENILRDAGSYSYNCKSDISEYFSSIRAHNTAEIDHAEPMPRLGTFLLGCWSKMDHISNIITTSDSLKWEGKYSTENGASHLRRIDFSSKIWSITDSIQGAKEVIILRWRLKPGEWIINGNCIQCDNIKLHIQTEDNISLHLSKGLESKYYNNKNEIPVFEIHVKAHSAVIRTHITLEGNP